MLIFVNRTLGNIFQWNLNEDTQFTWKKMRLKILSAKYRSSCLGLNVLIINIRKLKKMSDDADNSTRARCIDRPFYSTNSITFCRNENVDLHFASFFHNHMVKVNVKILPPVCPGPIYFPLSASGMVAIWQHKELKHEQPRLQFVYRNTETAMKDSLYAVEQTDFYRCRLPIF